MSEYLWFAVFKAEYYAITDRLRDKRKYLPIIVFIGAIILLISLQLAINLILDLFVRYSNDPNFTIESIRKNALETNVDTFFLAVYLNTFTAFFVPISIPMGRMNPKGYQMDVLISTPIKNRDILVGSFLAELILTAPFLCTFTSGIVVILTLAPISNNVIIPFLLTFFFIFLNTSLGLWVGIFISRFFFKLTKKKARVIITLTISILSVILLLAVDVILKNGYQSVLTNPILSLMPSTWIAVLVFSLVYGFSFNISIIIVVIGLLSLLTVVTIGELVLVNKADLLASLANSQISFSPNDEDLRFYDLKLRFYSYFRDLENWSRLILSFTFTLIVFYIFSFLLSDSLTINGENSLTTIFWGLTFFLTLLGSASTMIYIETAFFSIELQKMQTIFMQIPDGIKKVSRVKWIQAAFISLPMSIGVVVISNLMIPTQLFPIPITIFLVWLASIGLIGILIGIFELNPVKDEEDVMHIINALIYFLVVIVIEVLFTVLLFLTYTESWNKDQLLVLYTISLLGVFLFGYLIFSLGTANQNTYDLGSKKGIYTDRFLAIGKIVLAVLFCIVLPQLISVLVLLIGNLYIFTNSYIIHLSPYFLTLTLVLTYLIMCMLTKLILPKEIMKERKKISFQRSIMIFMGVLVSILSIVLLSSYLSPESSNSTIQFLLPEEPNIILYTLILVLFIIGAYSEELFFRKYLFTKLLKPTVDDGSIGYSMMSTIIITSLIFSIMHFPTSIITFLIYFILSSLLGLLFLCSNYSIKINTFFHLLYNILVLSFLI